MICLTFDTDHMYNDELMNDFLSEFKFPGKGTFFVWRPMPKVKWDEHETGLHPYFDFTEKSDKVLDKTMTYVKNKKGFRSHSCVSSHIILTQAMERGLQYSSNMNWLYHKNLVPYKHPWGLWELPIYYMDNMDFSESTFWKNNHIPFDDNTIHTALTNDFLFVFDFHPVHLLLNTPSLEYYKQFASLIWAGDPIPKDAAFKGEGTRTFFEKLCKGMAERNLVSYTCSEALSLF